MTLATPAQYAVRTAAPAPPPQPHSGRLRAAARSADDGLLPAAPATVRRTPELCGGSLPAAIRVALRAAHWIEEVDAGLRPAGHLRTLLRPGLAARWSLEERRPQPTGRFHRLGPVQVRRREPQPSCHLVLLFDHRGRILPTAMELRLDAGAWSVSEVERPGRPRLSALPGGWDEALGDPRCQPVMHG